MPMIAISGRLRFGGFSAAIVTSASCFAIGGAAAWDGAGGNVTIHPTKAIAQSTTALMTIHLTSRQFMVPRPEFPLRFAGQATGRGRDPKWRNSRKKGHASGTL